MPVDFSDISGDFPWFSDRSVTLNTEPDTWAEWFKSHIPFYTPMRMLGAYTPMRKLGAELISEPTVSGGPDCDSDVWGGCFSVATVVVFMAGWLEYILLGCLGALFISACCVIGVGINRSRNAWQDAFQGPLTVGALARVLHADVPAWAKHRALNLLPSILDSPGVWLNVESGNLNSIQGSQSLGTEESLETLLLRSLRANHYTLSSIKHGYLIPGGSESFKLLPPELQMKLLASKQGTHTTRTSYHDGQQACYLSTHLDWRAFVRLVTVVIRSCVAKQTPVGQEYLQALISTFCEVVKVGVVESAPNITVDIADVIVTLRQCACDLRDLSVINQSAYDRQARRSEVRLTMPPVEQDEQDDITESTPLLASGHRTSSFFTPGRSGRREGSYTVMNPAFAG